MELMGAAAASMIEHPFGIGLGMNNLISAEAELGWNVVHNAYLQVGVELGVVGFFLYLYFIWKTYAGLKPIERSAQHGFSELAFAIRLSLIAYLVGAMFGAVAFNWYFFYPGGMAVALKSMVKRGSSPLPEMEARAI
jgi:O-antigen ligase